MKRFERQQFDKNLKFMLTFNGSLPTYGHFLYVKSFLGNKTEKIFSLIGCAKSDKSYNHTKQLLSKTAKQLLSNIAKQLLSSYSKGHC